MLLNAAETDSDADDGDDDRDLGFAVVKAGALIWIKPLDASSELDADSFILRQDGRFRVMRGGEGNEWIDIIVPCYDYCVAVRYSVTRIEQATSAQCSASAAGCIDAITALSFDSKAVYPLMKFIGSKLLTLASYSADIRRPNLTTLNLMSMWGKPEVLIEAYESGRCKITSLSLRDLHNDSNKPHQNFLQVLQDPDSAAAKTLQSLHLRDFRPEAQATVEEYMIMLAVNRTLKFTGFDFYDSVRSYGISDEAIQALEKTRGLWVPGRPLAPSQRYAFLSVIRHCSSSLLPSEEPPRKRSRRERSAVCQVDFGRSDRCAIALVFEFAGEGVSRKIAINERLREFDSDFESDDERDGDEIWAHFLVRAGVV